MIFCDSRTLTVNLLKARQEPLLGINALSVHHMQELLDFSPVTQG
jgi:hypothetical protein